VRRGALFNAVPHARGHGVRAVAQRKHTPRALAIAELVRAGSAGCARWRWTQPLHPRPPPRSSEPLNVSVRLCLSGPAPRTGCASRGHQIVKERTPRSRATKLRRPLPADERPNVCVTRAERAKHARERQRERSERAARRVHAMLGRWCYVADL
jgi:hypothetical protein